MSKVLIQETAFKKLEKLCENSEINMSTLANEIFRKMLTNHKKEVSEIIKALRLKTKNGT